MSTRSQALSFSIFIDCGHKIVQMMLCQYSIFFIKLDVGNTPLKVLLVMLRLMVKQILMPMMLRMMVMPATCIFFLIASILTKTEKKRTRR